jgi:hypothetical protein
LLVAYRKRAAAANTGHQTPAWGGANHRNSRTSFSPAAGRRCLAKRAFAAGPPDNSSESNHCLPDQASLEDSISQTQKISDFGDLTILQGPAGGPVMGRHNQRRNDDQDQNQDQDQKQAELQAQLQGQAQGQAQGQGQGQWQFALSENENKNDNDNDNENKNENENSNELKNEVDNKLDNSVDNKVENSVDNDIKNNIENNIENKVEVAVDVKIDLDLSALPEDNDTIDIDTIHHIYGSVVMPDVVTQDMKGDGNQINIDQVNNIVDNDFLWDPDVRYDGKGDFKQDAWADGGHVKMDDTKVDIGGDGGTFGDTLTTSADAVVNQEAFTQNIVMGANIQFNSIEMNVAGHNLDDDHSV